MKNKPVYILEIVINTQHNGYVNEPIGVYSSEEKADFFMRKAISGFESKVDRELWIGTGKDFKPKDLHPIDVNISFHETIYTEDNYL